MFASLSHFQRGFFFQVFLIVNVRSLETKCVVRFAGENRKNAVSKSLFVSRPAINSKLRTPKFIIICLHNNGNSNNNNNNNDNRTFNDENKLPRVYLKIKAVIVTYRRLSVVLLA